MFGFVFDEGISIPLLITNKHVIDGVNVLKLRLSLSDPKDFETKIGIATYELEGELEHIIMRHPNPELDMAAIALAPLLNHLESEGLAGHGVMFAESDIATKGELAEASLAENILMIGYPIGLSDEKHNLPIVRQGILASDPQIPFNGKDQFLIDCACYPGSSGSPILLKEKNIFMDSEGNIGIGHRRSALIGVLFSGPVHNAKGQIVPQTIPTSTDDLTYTRIMINLGYAIPAARILDFKPIVSSKAPIGEVQFRFRKSLFEHAMPG